VDRQRFVRSIHEAFEHLDDRVFLTRHPLEFLLKTTGGVNSPEALRRTLLGAIERLRPTPDTPPSSLAWRHWRGLVLRYVDGASTKQIARELQISDRQVLRDHLQGLNAVAEILWLQIQGSDRGVLAESNLADRGEADANSFLQREDLEAEVARVVSLSDDGTTNLAEEFAGALATIRQLAAERGARIETAIPSDLPPVMLSPTVVRQIILCLLTAVAIDRPIPRIQVSATHGGSGVPVVFTLKASGSTPNGTAPPGDAQSLLDTARRLLESEGGRLDLVESASGARSFVLTLPTNPVATVLVVDDNPDIAELFRWYLAGGNYQVYQARTPPTALELARTLRPDVITLDVMMPSQDGWQILERLRADPETRAIPVIVCSILPERPLAQALGAADFLVKPVSPDSLLAALRHFGHPVAGPGRPDSPASRSSSRRP